jgi:glycosyltransferase 2 family protein
MNVLTHPRTRTLLAVALLAIVVWRLGAGPFLDGLRSVDLPAIAAALAIGAATTVCGAWRWAVVSRRLGMPMRVRPAVADCYQALFLNTVLPAGVLGDVGRAVAHGRTSGDVGRSARAVMIEKAAGQVVLVLVGAAVLVVEPAVLQVLEVPWTPILVVLALGAAAALAIRRVRSAVRTLAVDAWRGTSPAVLGLSLLALVGYLGLFLVAARTVGVTAPTVEVLPLLVLALFVMGLPVNVGGFGPREATAALAFGAVGLGAAAGLSTAVVYGVLTMVSTLPGALVLLARRVPSARLRPAVRMG